MSFSVVVPTLGRPSLGAVLAVRRTPAARGAGGASDDSATQAVEPRAAGEPGVDRRGSGGQPVGTAHIAVSVADDTVVRTIALTGDRYEIRRLTVEHALGLLLGRLREESY